MSRKDILNILNGQSMYNYFKKHHLDKNGVYIPFNEAMCVGEVTLDIFYDEFIQHRCNAHNITIEQYTEHVMIPLQVLFNNEFSHIILWFDDDMFCQINLLTLLAYLDQINFSGKINFNLVGNNFKLIQSLELIVDGYKDRYNQVMINKLMPENISLPVMKNGIELYLEYIKEENEITSYIKKYNYLDNNVLLMELFKGFSKYGLGDTQYIQLIEKCRGYY